MRKYFTFLILTACALLTIIPSIVFADGPEARKCSNAFSCSISELKSFAGGSGVDVNQTPETIAGNIINTAIGLLGVVAVALIVYAGGLWITAAGNDDKVEKAKSIIKTTVIGMVVVGLAYAITLFVVSFVTG